MKSRLLMLLSLVVLGVGIIGAVLTRVDAPETVVVEQVKEPEEVKILIWTPKENLKSGQFITRSDLQLESILESQALSFGIKQDVELQFVAGMVVNRDIEARAPILPEDITLPSQSGYFRLVMEPGTVPYPISVDLGSVVGGVIEAGSQVDVLALGAKSQNLSNGAPVRNVGELALTPILVNVKVLQVANSGSDSAENSEASTPKAFGGQGNAGEGLPLASVILQLSRKEVAMLTVAKRIAQLEVHVSTGETSLSELSADAGDVMTNFTTVKEFRPNTNRLGNSGEAQ